MVSFLQVALQSTLIGILGISGFAKLADPSVATRFINIVAPGYRHHSRIVVIILSLVEIALAGALWLSPFIASCAAFLIFFFFTTLLLWAIYRKVSVRCGCFGSLERASLSQSVQRNLIWGGSTLAFAVTQTSYAFDPFVESAVLASALLASCYQLIGIVAHTRSSSPSLLPRRAFLKVFAGSLAALTWAAIRPSLTDAAGCCKCEYQHHYDPPWRCCFVPPVATLHYHHYWKRCYNTCSGARGSWHKITPDNCECDCGACSDSTWVQDECCYQWECGCCGPSCPC
jgi:hypothetical protein